MPNIDFSRFQDVNFLADKSETLEHTLEFWYFVYQYSTVTYTYLSSIISWNLHAHVSITHSSNALSVACFPVYDQDDATKYTEKTIETDNYSAWNIVRCGVNYRSKKYFLNSLERDLELETPPTINSDTTNFRISLPASTATNWGFLFIRELKLWRQYNFNLIQTTYINLTPSLYPGLLHFYRNQFKYEIDVAGIITIYIIDEKDALNRTNLTPRNDWLSYNVVDSRYSELSLCVEGEYFDTILVSCESKQVTRFSKHEMSFLQQSN